MTICATVSSDECVCSSVHLCVWATYFKLTSVPFRHNIAIPVCHVFLHLRSIYRLYLQVLHGWLNMIKHTNHMSTTRLVTCSSSFVLLSTAVASCSPTRTNLLPTVISSTWGLLSCLADPLWSRVVFSRCWLVFIPVGSVFQSWVFCFFPLLLISASICLLMCMKLTVPVIILHFKID